MPTPTATSIPTQQERYARPRAIMHWLLALVVLLMLAGGLKGIAPLDDADPAKIDVLRIHVMMGLATLAIFLIYALAAVAFRAPRKITSGSGALDLLAKAVPIVLRLGVLVMIASGMATVKILGLGDILFAAEAGALPIQLASLPSAQIHAWTARFLLALVGLHVVGAAYHQLVLRDSLLSRMSIWRGARKARD
jgi:cytochrome b561